MMNNNRLEWSLEAMGDVDHRSVVAPYVRLDMHKQGVNGDVVYKYDLRITQPNKRFINSDVMHSLEHFLLDNLRKITLDFVCVAPMGCQTGFYLILMNKHEPRVIFEYYEQALQAILTATSVPLSTELTCGHAANHNLAGTQELAREILSHKEKWINVFR